MNDHLRTLFIHNPGHGFLIRYIHGDILYARNIRVRPYVRTDHLISPRRCFFADIVSQLTADTCHE